MHEWVFQQRSLDHFAALVSEGEYFELANERKTINKDRCVAAGSYVSLAEERVAFQDDFLALIPAGAHLHLSKLPKIPTSVHKGLLNIMVRYARIFRMFEVRGDTGFPISMIRTVRRRDHSQWVGLTCLAHLMVAADSSMTHAYAFHLLERSAEHSSELKEQLQTYRDKTEEGKFHSSARLTICRSLVDNLAAAFPERFGNGKLVYEALDISQEFLDGEISEDEESEEDGSDNEDE